jgi:hypothetical protein
MLPASRTRSPLSGPARFVERRASADVVWFESVMAGLFDRYAPSECSRTDLMHGCTSMAHCTAERKNQRCVIDNFQKMEGYFLFLG